MHLHRLSGRKVCTAVLRKGRRWQGKTMTIVYTTDTLRKMKRREAAVPGVYAGTLASTKLHKSAVVRNRMRRRCREALRITLQAMDSAPSVELLLCPKTASLHASFGDIVQDIQTFLRSPLWQQKRPPARSGIFSSSSPSST